MENKKLGLTILLIGLVIGTILIYLIGMLGGRSNEIGCFPTEECKGIESSLTITHISFGVIGFIIALGIYLLIFTKGEEAIIKRLEEEKMMKLKEEKFDIILKALDQFEQKVFKAVKEQDGITQNMLPLRTNLSKAKISYVLTELEKRGLIKRIQKNKTLAVYLKENI